MSAHAPTFRPSRCRAIDVVSRDGHTIEFYATDAFVDRGVFDFRIRAADPSRDTVGQVTAWKTDAEKASAVDFIFAEVSR